MISEDPVGRVLRRHFHPAAQMVLTDPFEIAARLRVDKKVMAEAAFDEDVLDARQGVKLSVQGKTLLVPGLEVPARCGRQAVTVAAGPFPLPPAADRSVEVCRRAAHIGDGSAKIFSPRQCLGFLEYR